MSTAVWNRIFEYSESKGANRLILMCIGDNAHDDGYAYPGATEIARKSRMARRHIYRIIEKLEEDGELYVERYEKEKPSEVVGGGKSNRYLVLAGLTAAQIDTALRKKLGKDTREVNEILDTIRKRRMSFARRHNKRKPTFSGANGKITKTGDKMSPVDVGDQTGDFFAKTGDILTPTGDFFAKTGDIAVSPEPEPLLVEPEPLGGAPNESDPNVALALAEQEMAGLDTDAAWDLIESASVQTDEPAQTETKPKRASRAKEPKAKKDRAPLPPAISRFVAVWGKQPRAEQRKVILELVKDDTVSLDQWEKAMRAWLMKGYNCFNIGGQLDWYRDGVPTYNGNGAHKPNAPQRKQMTAEQYNALLAEKRARQAQA